MRREREERKEQEGERREEKRMRTIKVSYTFMSLIPIQNTSHNLIPVMQQTKT